MKTAVGYVIKYLKDDIHFAIARERTGVLIVKVTRLPGGKLGRVVIVITLVGGQTAIRILKEVIKTRHTSNFVRGCTYMAPAMCSSYAKLRWLCSYGSKYVCCGCSVHDECGYVCPNQICAPWNIITELRYISRVRLMFRAYKFRELWVRSHHI